MLGWMVVVVDELVIGWVLVVAVAGAETALGVVVGIVVVAVFVFVVGVEAEVAVQSWVVAGVCGSQNAYAVVGEAGPCVARVVVVGVVCLGFEVVVVVEFISGW